MTTTLASGANSRYGYWLLNMIGSVEANSPVFDRIVVYDLGLTPWQRRLLRNARGVEIRTVPPFVPHWREGRTWKTWIWTHVEGDRVVWLDAGLTVLRPLDDFLAGIDERGYFVVSQGHPIRDSIPKDYYPLYAFPRERAESISIAAGILGFARDSSFYSDVIVPAFEDAARGLSVGFSAREVARLNTGLDRNPEPTLRDCTHFRWDQTILNLRFYSAVAAPVVADLYRFAGWHSPSDHPQQVIWSHRRRGDYGFIARVPYGGLFAPVGRLFGLGFRARWWYLHHRWLVRPSTYLNRLRRLRLG
jgi:hypothetical protein